MPIIAVVDYDMGNLHSACKGLQNAGATTKITDVAAEIEQADAVVLPGVGSFDPAVQHLRSRGLEEPIKRVIASGTPFLPCGCSYLRIRKFILSILTMLIRLIRQFAPLQLPTDHNTSRRRSRGII